MKSVTLPIVNKLGMHARASAKFVSLASTFDSDVTIAKAGRKVNGKSIMGIMMLAAGLGAEVSIAASGPDEEAAVEGLSTLVRNRFGEAE